MRLLRGALLVIAGAASACAGSTTSPTTTTTTTTTTTATESFSGILELGGRSAHVFTATNAGTVTATITSLGSPVVVGFGVGGYDAASGVCALTTSVNTTIGTSPYVSVASSTLSIAVDPGTYCVQIYDPGNLSALTSFAPVSGPTAFSVSIIRPT